MVDDLGEIKVRIEQEGAEEAAQQIQEGGEAGIGSGDGGDGFFADAGGGGRGKGGRGKGIKGILSKLVRIASKVLGLLAIPGVLDVLGAIFDLFQAFLAPIGAVIVKLFAPLIRQLASSVGLWFDFLDDPAGVFRDGVSMALGVLENRLSLLTSTFKRQFENFKDALPSTLAKALANATLFGGLTNKFQTLINIMRNLANFFGVNTSSGREPINSDVGSGNVSEGTGAMRFGQRISSGETINVNVRGYSQDETRHLLSRELGWR